MKYILMGVTLFSLLMLSTSCKDNPGSKTDTVRRDEFFTAASLNQRDRIKELLQEGVDIDIKNQKGNTALMESVIHENPDAVSLLLTLGADVNASDIQGVTVLMHAVKTRNLGIIEQIIDASPEEAAVAAKKNGLQQNAYTDIIRLLIKEFMEDKKTEKISVTPPAEKEKETAPVYKVVEMSQKEKDQIKTEIKQEVAAENYIKLLVKELMEDTKIKENGSLPLAGREKEPPPVYIMVEMSQWDKDRLKNEIKQELSNEFLSLMAESRSVQKAIQTPEERVELLRLTDLIKELAQTHPDER